MNDLQKQLDKTLSHLADEFSQIRTGRATAELIEPVKVEAYGTTNQLKALGNITVGDAKTLNVQVWDKTIIPDIEKGIGAANLGLSCSSDGDIIRVKVPDLTTERRHEFVKVAKDRTEVAKHGIRNTRHKFLKDIDQAVKDGMAESEGKRQKEVVEKAVKEANGKLAEMLAEKEKDILAI